ncbi:hypothetical protein [uncultured Flavobacterium sp.]|uniref:tetratricopeptide repeat-containing sensor histidine kinase n=1 Tax=uncultured Flavobacterium sp. TaxID=165435 RepID=UPI0030EF3FD0|tara:strand:+ start:114426 stop:116066 length:1641 start_codon:yes stop_codon:yes gene_type:complete
MKHFPLLFIIFILSSCEKETKPNAPSSLTYTDYIEKANNKVSTLELDSAYFYFNQAKLSCKDNEKEMKIYALLGMANIQKTNCDFVGLEETATEAFGIDNETNYKEYLNNFLGIAYNEQADYENALLYYNKTLDNSKNETNRLTIKNNIAVNYLDQKEYVKSIDVLEKLLKNDSLKIYPSEYARVTDNLGFAYFKIKKDSLAKEYLYASLNIRDSINDDYDKIASYIHLSNFYDENNPVLSKEFANKALQSATIVNSPDDKLEALDLLIKNPTNKKAVNHFAIYSHINDSISKIRQSAKNQYSKIKYDSKITLEKNEKLKVEKEFITYLFIGFGIIALLIYFLIRFKNKNKLQKSTYEAETRISKKLHDELANDVYNTMTFAETQDLSDLNKKEHFLNQIENIYNRTRNISLENSEIDTGENFKENLSLLLSGFNSEDTNVIIKNFEAINWTKTKKITKITVYRILQELLVNMKKHSQSNLVVIGFEDKGKSYEINYSDNGIGSSKSLRLKNGLQNVENRIKTINGTFTFETETQKGFKAKIVFPK